MFHIEPGVGMINDTSFAAQIALYGYLEGLATLRLEDPQDDLLTALCFAELPGEDGEARRLTMPEVVSFANLLYSAGTETVGRLLGNAAVLLARHPDERAVLVAEPDVIPNAVEELLRYEAPSPVQGRWTTEEVTRHGVTIPPDSKVLLLTGSAGRDDEVFPDADRFDVRRNFQHHVSFGYGIHFCVGAALARMEGRIALEEVLRRHPTWELDPDHVIRQHTSTVRGLLRGPRPRRLTPTARQSSQSVRSSRAGWRPRRIGDSGESTSRMRCQAVTMSPRPRRHPTSSSSVAAPRSHVGPLLPGRHRPQQQGLVVVDHRRGEGPGEFPAVTGRGPGRDPRALVPGVRPPRRAAPSPARGRRPRPAHRPRTIPRSCASRAPAP